MLNKQQAKHAAKFTRDLLELLDGNGGSHWTKGRFFGWTNWRGRAAKDHKLCYCVTGGIRQLKRRGRSNTIAFFVRNAITDMVGTAIPAWNDDPRTKWVDVKQVLTSVATDFDRLAAK